jgi:hypothetical protein
MTLEELTNEELLDVFKSAVENLPGGGAEAREWFEEVKKELLYRMAGW